jgi:hypothetical protein
MAVLSAAERNRLKSSSFGLPPTSQSEGKYPMPDRSHAANAKARASQHVKRGNLTAAEKKRIDAKANALLARGK